MLQVLHNNNMMPEDRYAIILKTVPATIHMVLDCPPVKELLNNGADVKHLEACLALEIARTANMLSVGGNLRQGQSVEIAKILISEYPGESLQDFCLCLRNGLKGKYQIDGKSDIFRFDVLVIMNWFKAYLSEKYDIVEEKLKNEKDNLYAYVRTVALPPAQAYKRVHDLPLVFSPVINKEARKLLWERSFYAMSQMRGRRILPLTDNEILKEGRVKPPGKVHSSTAEGEIKAHNEKIRKYQEQAFRERHPSATEEQVRAFLESVKKYEPREL
jgi:hypothetical protein